MGTEEREKLFERAVARQLRGESAGAACLDAEMIAALHEGRLSEREMKVAREHMANCTRCASVLAELRATDEVVLNGEENSFREKKLTVSGVSELRVETFGVKTPRDISSWRGRKRWTWAAPAGAIAAGLIVWVTMHEVRQETAAPARSGARVEMEMREAAPSAEEQERSKAAERNDAGVESSARQSRGGAAGDTRSNKYRDENLRAAAPAAPPAENTKTADGVTTRARVQSGEPVPEKKPADLPVLGRNAMEKEELKADAQRKAPSATAPQPAAAGPSSSAKPDTHKDEGDVARSLGTNADAIADKKAKANTSADASANVSGVAKQQMQVAEDSGGNRYDALKNKGALVAKVARADNLIVAPGDLVNWKVGRAGAIERSVDGGITWVRQNSGVRVDLLRGAATSEAVCWVVGRGGVILRSVDGGGHWMKAGAPIQEDGVTIRADDGMRATVSDTGRGKSFATSDGGVTWVRVGTE